MNIIKENLDELNSVIKIQIDPEDYSEKVEEVLKDYKRKAKVDGFRPGKVPFSLVKKLYGTSALVDQVNHLLSDNLNKYLIENKFRLLGEPLPNEDTPTIDWENQTNFEFNFDIAEAPEVVMELSKKDKIAQYVIEADDKIIDEQIENFSQRAGAYVPVEKAEDNDLIKGDFIQLDELGEPITDGLRMEDARISVGTIADKEIKAQFIGASANQEMILDPNIAFPNDADRAAMFKITKDQLGKISGQFKYTISEISRFVPANVDQELFDKIFGEGNISSLEEFRQRIKTDLEAQFVNEGNYKFHIDARDALIKKADFNLPDAFLKRWMLATTKDESLTMEKIEEEYPSFKNDLIWQLIKEKFIVEQSITAEQDEIRSYAISDAANRFRQYGMYDVPEEQLAGLAESILSSKEEERKIIESIQENKVITFVKDSVKVEDKKVSLDEFKKLFE